MKHDTRRGDDLDLVSGCDDLARERSGPRVSGLCLNELLCNAGRVVDVSTRGMRLQSWRRWKPGQRRSITLIEGSAVVRVEAECVWCRKIGTMRHTIGLAFTTVSPESAKLLGEIVSRQSKSDQLRLAA
jgi:hypothetical protein